MEPATMRACAAPNELRAIEHFIWDFDGTLFNTYPLIIQDFRYALRHFGYDAEPVAIMEQMLTNVNHAVRHYAEKFGIGFENLFAVYNAEHLRTYPSLDAMPLPGVEKVLSAIRDRGGKNYILTHRARESVEAYLKKYRLAQYFSHIVAPGTPGFAVKPAPDGILYLLRKYALSADTVAMVGDREIDLVCGRCAGVRTVHYVCADVPQQLTCDWRFAEYETFAKWLQM